MSPLNLRSRIQDNDKEADSLFICLKEGKEDSFEEIVPGVNVELGKNNNIIGVEILCVSKLFAREKKKMALLSKFARLTS